MEVMSFRDWMLDCRGCMACLSVAFSLHLLWVLFAISLRNLSPLYKILSEVGRGNL
jgi:hypothetical protein